jgi:hypothetical protein
LFTRPAGGLQVCVHLPRRSSFGQAQTGENDLPVRMVRVMRARDRKTAPKPIAGRQLPPSMDRYLTP